MAIKKRGGKKRSDKKPGRKSRGFYTGQTHAKLVSGMTNTAAGQWVSVKQARVSNKLEAEVDAQAAHHAENSVRNKADRAKHKYD